MPLSILISGRPLKANRKLKNVFTVKGKCASNNNLAPSKLNMTPISVASDAEIESTTPSKTPNKSMKNILNDVDWSISPIRNRFVTIFRFMDTEESFTTLPVVAKQKTGKDVTTTKKSFEEISMQVENESPSKEKNVSSNEPKSATPKKNLTEFISTIGLSKVTQENVQEKAVKRSMETQAGSAKVVKKKRSRLKNNNKEPNILEEGVSNHSMRTRSRSNKTIDIPLAAYCSMINKSINQTMDVDQDDAGVEKHPSPISKASAKTNNTTFKNKKNESITKKNNQSIVKRNNRKNISKNLQVTFNEESICKQDTEESFTTLPVVAKQKTGKDVTTTKKSFEEFISTIGLSKVTQENVQEKAVKRSMETQAGSAKVVKKKRSRLKNNNKEPNILEEGVSNRSMRTRSRSNKTIDIPLAAYCSMINKSINQTMDVDQDDAGVEKHPSPISKASAKTNNVTTFNNQSIVKRNNRKNISKNLQIIFNEESICKQDFVPSEPLTKKAKRAKRKRVCMPTKNRKSSSKSSTSKSSNDTTILNKSRNKSNVSNRSKAVKSLQSIFDDQQPGTSKATSMSVPCSAVDEVEERPDTEHDENQLADQQAPEQQVLADAEELEENSESEADRQAREDEECDKGDLFEIERWERPPVKVQIKNRETNNYDNRDDVQYNSCSTFWRSVSRNVGDPNNLLISRITGGSGCFTGQIKLRARKRKGEQRPKEELFFFIARGPVWFTCNSSTWRSHTGEHVVIPKGQKYDVENKSNHETRIVYFSPKT
ncbi:micronuclear linker histone polyprotein-like isoform X4 [Clytia hemisphaerica]|uniref:micronuclear linker histone polyprotein-like isoform X4 n=1 Tax=Clytia hemisphaerica TaxID=252671 RepID=UPI0034D494BC